MSEWVREQSVSFSSQGPARALQVIDSRPRNEDAREATRCPPPSRVLRLRRVTADARVPRAFLSLS